MTWIVATATLPAGTRRVAATTLMARRTFRTISHMTHPGWPEHPSGKTGGNYCRHLQHVQHDQTDDGQAVSTFGRGPDPLARARFTVRPLTAFRKLRGLLGAYGGLRG